MITSNWRLSLQFRKSIAPGIYFFLIAVGVMWPYRSPRPVVTTGSDLVCHLSAIVEAANALREGQFPIRVAPASLDGTRYPFFSYYGNLPFTASGAMYAWGIDPYTAFKLTLLASITLGGWFTYRTTLSVTRRIGPAMVAGTVFAAAPYMFCDVHARTAFPESISFNLLPAVLYYLLRTFIRGGTVNVLLGGIAWAAVALSHNIAYLYGSAYFCLLLIFMATPRWRYVRRMIRVGMSYLLGLLLVTWYLTPQLVSVHRLTIHGELHIPIGEAALTQLDVLLWPTLKTPPLSATPNLGLQVGWPILAGVLFTAMGLMLRCGGAIRTRLVGALLGLFFISFVMAWSPAAFNFWKYLPSQFYFVQRSFRLLMFVTVFGSVLAGWALAAWLPHVRLKPSIYALIAIIATLALALPYLIEREDLPSDVIGRLVRQPDLRGGYPVDTNSLTNYVQRPEIALASTKFHPDLDYAGVEFGGSSDGLSLDLQPVWVLPPPAGWSLEIAGRAVAPNNLFPVRLTVRLNGQEIESTMNKAGDFQLKALIAEALPQVPTTLNLDADQVFPPDAPANLTYPVHPVGALPIQIRRIRFAPPAGASPPDMPLVRAVEVRSGVTFGRVTSLSLDLDKPFLVELPVLAYLESQEVLDNGQPMQAENIGRFLAVRLNAGPHKLTVVYTGNRLANWMSGAAWIVVVFGFGLFGLRKIVSKVASCT